MPNLLPLYDYAMSFVTDREHPRYRVRTDCTLVREHDGAWLGDKTIDASWNGLLIEASAEARIGERVRVAIRLPRSSMWIEAEGLIARLSRGRRGPEDQSAIGVRFTRMKGMERVLYGMSIRHHRVVRGQRGNARDYAAAIKRMATES